MRRFAILMSLLWTGCQASYNSTKNGAVTITQADLEKTLEAKYRVEVTKASLDFQRAYAELDVNLTGLEKRDAMVRWVIKAVDTQAKSLANQRTSLLAKELKALSKTYPRLNDPGFSLMLGITMNKKALNFLKMAAFNLTRETLAKNSQTTQDPYYVLNLVSNLLFTHNSLYHAYNSFVELNYRNCSSLSYPLQTDVDAKIRKNGLSGYEDYYAFEHALASAAGQEVDALHMKNILGQDQIMYGIFAWHVTSTVSLRYGMSIEGVRKDAIAYLKYDTADRAISHAGEDVRACSMALRSIFILTKGLAGADSASLAWITAGFIFSNESLYETVKPTGLIAPKLGLEALATNATKWETLQEFSRENPTYPSEFIDARIASGDKIGPNWSQALIDWVAKGE